MSFTVRQPIETVTVGIAGRIGAGKTSAAQYLSSHHGFQYIRYSQVLSAWLGNSQINTSLQSLGWKVMNGGKQSELNRRLMAQMAPNTNVVVDGLRHPIDYESLVKKFESSFHLLYIDAAEETRWLRLKGRARYQSVEQFEAADSHPVEQHIEKIKAKAEIVLSNEDSIEKLYASLDVVIHNLTSKDPQ